MALSHEVDKWIACKVSNWVWKGLWTSFHTFGCEVHYSDEDFHVCSTSTSEQRTYQEVYCTTILYDGFHLAKSRL